MSADGRYGQAKLRGLESEVGRRLPPQRWVGCGGGGSGAAQVLLCADLWKEERVLHAAYCDGRGVTEAFIRNGVAHAFRSLGPAAAAAADPASWDYEVREIHAVQQRFSASWPPQCAILPVFVNIVYSVMRL